MKSILAISWWYPPLLGPRAIQVAKLLHQLGGMGWNIDVLAPAKVNLPFGTPLDDELWDYYQGEINVHRVDAPKLMRLYQLLGKLFPGIGYLPDLQLIWAQKLVEEVGDLLDLNSYDGLVSFAQPWSVHLAAEKIAQTSGLPWLAHFSDPWSDNPYNTHLTDAHLEKMVELEKGVINSADTLVFTNTPTVDLVLDKYEKNTRKKAFVVPHAFDSGLLSKLRESPMKFSEEKLNILHIGNIYRIRSPQALFGALSLLKQEAFPINEISLTFVGSISKKRYWMKLCAEAGILDSVRFEKPVSYFESLAIGKKADVLLTIDAANEKQSVFLPSKLVDYLGIGNTIFGLTPKRGVSADLLRSLKMPVAEPDDVQAIATAIRGLHSDWKKGKLRQSADKKNIIDQYELGKAARQFEIILEGMIQLK